jgi:hypothetical protein
MRKKIHPINSSASFICLIFLIRLFSGLDLYSQTTITGYINDASTGEELIGASVYHNGPELLGTSTNAYGYYSLTLQSDSVNLVVSYIGYNNFKTSFRLIEDTLLRIKLEPQLELQQVTVRGDRVESVVESSQMSTINVPIEQIKSLPAFLGEVDIFKALQMLPGVQSGSEGSSGLYVRGGGPDQNLILLDGVPVYNASHLFGFFSVFNADAVNRVELVKGGFPARYGGRLSSVVDIRLKEGNDQKIHGAGSIGLIASKITLDGPIGKNKKTTFLVSGRRTYIDLLAQPIILAANDGQSRGGYYFYDINAKINHRFSDKDRLFLSGYFGRDRFYFVDKFKGGTSDETYRGEINWGNATGVLRYNRLLSPKLFSNLTLTYSAYDFEIGSSYEEIQFPGTINEEISSFNLGYFSGINDWSLRYDVDYNPTPNHYLRFGVSGIYHTFKPGATEFFNSGAIGDLDTTLSTGDIIAGEYAIYIEDDMKLGNRVKINAGLHASGFTVNDLFYTSLQPRLSIGVLLTEDLSLKASYADMTQYIHLLTNVGVGLPTDLWVPSTDIIEPEQSRQVALGFAYNLKDLFELSIEGYYKEMDGIIEYKDGASYLDNGSASWEDKVEAGQGWSYGAELFLQKKKGATSGWLGYTLSWTERQFPEINFGEKFPYRYDRRHDLTIAVVHRFNENIEISGAWIYGTGNAISLPVAQFEGLFGNSLNYYESRNGFRMAAYHRLDFGARFSKQKKRYKRTFVIGLYNTYSRKNPFFIYEGYDERTGRDAYKQVSLFPTLPSFAWQFEF